jgi:peptidoglycan hydrolase CwlO-like protein
MKKILLVLLVSTLITIIISCNSSSSKDTPETSSGYVEDYKPTVSEDGDYHTINGDAKQIQYQGSQEQKKDLEAIDEYMKENPNF